MKNKKKYFKILVIFIIVFHINFSFAYKNNYTYIICADKQKNWYWLKDIKLEGRWASKFINNKFIVNYFVLEGGFEQYKLLEKECINYFGSRFIYPQPAMSWLSSWSVFIDKNGNVFPGH